MDMVGKHVMLAERIRDFVDNFFARFVDKLLDPYVE
jgi:hypothetical protein